MKKIFLIYLSVMITLIPLASSVKAENVYITIEPKDIYAETTTKTIISWNLSTTGKAFSVEATIKFRYNDANGKLVAVISTTGKIKSGPNGLTITRIYGEKLDDHTINVVLIVSYATDFDTWYGSKNVKV